MEEALKFFIEYKELIFIITLSIFLGIEVISHVPAVMHTPLMSGSNAIHGVVIIGAIIVMGHAHETLSLIFGFLAVILAGVVKLRPLLGGRLQAGLRGLLGERLEHLCQGK